MLSLVSGTCSKRASCTQQLLGLWSKGIASAVTTTFTAETWVVFISTLWPKSSSCHIWSSKNMIYFSVFSLPHFLSPVVPFTLPWPNDCSQCDCGQWMRTSSKKLSMWADGYDNWLNRNPFTMHTCASHQVFTFPKSDNFICELYLSKVGKNSRLKPQWIDR